jgi:hypothetical protein
MNKPYSKTWHYEATVVLVILGVTVYTSGNQSIEYLGALAVFFSFMLMEIQDRSNEKEKLKAVPDNECYHWAPRYLYLKEFLWVSYFLMKGAHSALVGSFIFMLYPLWRKLYRKFINPLSV